MANDRGFDPYRFKNQVADAILLFRPVTGSTAHGNGFAARLLAMKNTVVQFAVGLAAALSLVILSGISLSALALFIISGLFLLLILNRVLGIEIVLPNVPGFMA